MRISDHRYERDRLRHDLAVRLLGHQARTHTIQAWTGLTPDRIRKLHRHRKPSERGRRHRGKSPRRVAFFLHSHRHKFETGVLASLLSIFEVLPAHAPVQLPCTLPCVTRGMLLCDAFEAYRAMVPVARITFEHATLLVQALVRGDELRLAACTLCQGLTVVDRLALFQPCCVQCRPPT